MIAKNRQLISYQVNELAKTIDIKWSDVITENGNVIASNNHRCSCSNKSNFLGMVTNASNTGSISMTNAGAIAGAVWN